MKKGGVFTNPAGEDIFAIDECENKKTVAFRTRLFFCRLLEIIQED